MKVRKVFRIAAMSLLFTGIAVWAVMPKAVERNFQADLTPTWYFFDWAAKAPYAPVFQVLDTESSLGRYAMKAKAITLKDLVKMHGHLCDGLVFAACALELAFRQLYPDGIIDRTDTGGITNNSPCFGDVMAYLTGGRIRFGAQKIAPSLKVEFIIYRFSTRQAVKVSLKSGMFPEELSALENKIRSEQFTAEELDRCQAEQWEFAKNMLLSPPETFFTVELLPDFEWTPDDYPKISRRGDVVNKDFPR